MFCLSVVIFRVTLALLAFCGSLGWLLLTTLCVKRGGDGVGNVEEETTNICGGGNHSSSSNNTKVLNNLSTGGLSKASSSSKKVAGDSHPHQQQSQSVIYRVVGSRSSTRRSTAADTSDLNPGSSSCSIGGSSRPNNNPSNSFKPSNSPISASSPHQNRSATLPVGFVDPSRIISGKGGHNK